MTQPYKDQNLGILLTGELQDGKKKRRFVVLTHVALHWYKRAEGDLFGEEKGFVKLESIEMVKPGPTAFEVVTFDKDGHMFITKSQEERSVWVNAIHRAKRAHEHRGRMLKKRLTLTGVDFKDFFATSVEIVSVKSSKSTVPEEVIMRSPSWGQRFTRHVCT